MDKTYTRRGVMAGAAASAAVLTVAPACAQAPAIHDVEIQSFKFDPPSLQVQVGDTIRWTNHDLAPHTATADNFGWDTAEITTGESGEIVVTEDMETSYFCAFHPHMTGTVEIL